MKEKFTRRRLLGSGAVLAATGLAGCSQFTGEDDIQDSDGDGVIDSEDYAPRDASVQRAEQVREREQPSRTRTEADPTTEADSTTDAEPTTDPDGTTRRPTNGVVAASRLVSRWPFRSGLGDVVGDNDISVERGSPDIGAHQGRASVALDGSVGLMISTGTNRELSIMRPDGGPASIGGWVYFDQPTGTRHPDGGRPIHHVFRNDAEYVINGVPVGDDVQLGLSIRSQSGGVGYATRDHTTGEMIVPTNEWHHVMYVVDPQSSLAFYLDGERRFDTDEMPGYSPNVSDYWSHETVGSWYGTGSPDWYNLLVGKLADLRIYDTGLTDDEVAQIVVNTR